MTDARFHDGRTHSDVDDDLFDASIPNDAEFMAATRQLQIVSRLKGIDKTLLHRVFDFSRVDVARLRVDSDN